MDIFSRVSAASIGSESYRRFMENDEVLALHYALDKQTLSQNGAVTDPDTLIVEVDGKVPQGGVSAQVSITPTVPLDVKAAKVLAQKLGISQSAVRHLEEEGLLECPLDIRKKKLCETVSFVLLAGWDKR